MTEEDDQKDVIEIPVLPTVGGTQRRHMQRSASADWSVRKVKQRGKRLLRAGMNCLDSTQDRAETEESEDDRSDKSAAACRNRIIGFLRCQSEEIWREKSRGSNLRTVVTCE